MDFPNSCTIEPPSSENEYHSMCYGTPITVECRYKDILEVDSTKNTEIESAWLALPPGTPIKPKSRVTLDNGNQYTASSGIRDVRRLSDGEIEYVRVILGFPLNRGSLA